MTLTGTIYEPCGCVWGYGGCDHTGRRDAACYCTDPNHHTEENTP